MTVRVAGSAFLLAASLGFAAGPAQAGGCFGQECYRRVATPPVYDTVTEQQLVVPPRTIHRTIPPVYDTVTERVLVAPPTRRWTTRYDAHGHLIGCWITTPPQYALTARHVLVREAEVVPETLPPVYRTHARRVLVQPGGSTWVPVGHGHHGLDHDGLDFHVGSIPDRFGIAGASSADVAVGLGFSTGSIYDGYR